MTAETMSSIQSGDYALLTSKARAILDILLFEYEASGAEGLTRRQIAHHLGQRRLYPHDDRALHTLADLGLIAIYTETRRYAMARRFDDASILQMSGIAMHTRYHVHTLNEFAYGEVRALLGYAPTQSGGLRGLLGRLRQRSD